MKQEHSIFKAIVEVSHQLDCDIARNICEKYELPMWKDVEEAFRYVDYEDEDKPTYLLYAEYDEDSIGFYIDCVDDEDDEDEFNIVSITEFEALAEDYNPQFKSVDDILTKLKELNHILNSK